MTCREVFDFLMDYNDGVLPPLVRLRFVVHLGLCAECRAYLKSYRLTVAAARTAHGAAVDPPGDSPQTEVPAELIEAILKARRES
jgi:hypothetical protein